MSASLEKKPIVDPDIYSKDYFLADNEGWREYKADLDLHVHPKFARALELAHVSGSDSVLDIGCGRGELLYYCASSGASVLGLDYSSAAVEISRETIRRLPVEQQGRARAEVGEAATYDFKEKFSIVFMIETLEHMHDWQLVESFDRVNKALTEDGRLIIITPNYYYERYLLPVKRFFNIPVNLIKLPGRMFKEKYRKAGIAALLRKTFRIFPDRGELNRLMHVNVTTPGKVRRLLDRFDAVVRCEDHSKNVLSILMGRWWGRDIVAIAKKNVKIS